ncbi:sulfatase-like hydrolase/transferase [Blastopirellula marina]|uniref:N-acetylgalactosamine-6-sulfatase n=1 Tax=Blastopirellula marina TaxID=124 RepID=A0A2S8GQW9_9BACT|nr:sulfatase-like hydrolase/transferase [Blastopirellula marina]PQO46761.1 N-acetylgalactosamine-6-sulfatase [Blastopirellula marina]
MKQICLSLLAFAAALLVALPHASAADQPNIVLIVADDLGFRDVGFNGCQEIPTPNLDRLAAHGIAFDAGYVSHPYCSPSRAGLLTGRYQQHFGHECNPEPKIAAEGETAPGLPLDEVTLADVLKTAGYATGAIGKWHLGDSRAYWPDKRGFDHWFGFSGGGMSYWGDVGPRREMFGVHRGDDLVPKAELTHLTDDFSNEAVKFIRAHRDQPYFLYLAYNAPHAPDHATRRHLERVEHIEYGDRAVYGAMVAAMDAGIGQVLEAIAANDATDDTLVIFLSDNGGRRDHAVNFPYRGHKGMLFEGGVRVPFALSWPGTFPQGIRYESPVTSLDLFPTILAAAGVQPAAPMRLDGQNILANLKENQPLPARDLFWRYAVGEGQHGYAVRSGSMKLVFSSYKNRKLLFDLASDPYEQHDLAAERPAEVERLWGLIQKWDEGNIEPRWLDPHGPNVRKEEADRQQVLDAASRGERK